MNPPLSGCKITCISTDWRHLPFKCCCMKINGRDVDPILCYFMFANAGDH